MKPKWFAIVRGLEVGIRFATWTTVEPLVSGYPGAVYRGFTSQGAAATWYQQSTVGSNGAASISVSTPMSTPMYAPSVPAQANVASPTTVQGLNTGIWTDGSARNGAAGWACIGVVNGTIKWEAYGPVTAEQPPTNNRAELTAILMALTLQPQANMLSCPIVTDSEYSINACTIYYDNWVANGWRTTTGAPVKNVDLIQQVTALIRANGTQLLHTRGHAADPYNNRVDVLAAQGVTAGTNTLIQCA